MNVSSNAVLVAASVNASPVTLSQESVTTEAPLVTAVVTAASRPSFRQFCAPTYWMWAPGAMVCDDSTSSACSGYQPLPPQSASVVHRRRGDVGELGGRQRVRGVVELKYCCASASRVGES